MRRSPRALGVDPRSRHLPPRAVLDHYVTSVIFFADRRFYRWQAKIPSEFAANPYKSRASMYMRDFSKMYESARNSERNQGNIY
jgi:hypothetical protein